MRWPFVAYFIVLHLVVAKLLWSRLHPFDYQAQVRADVIANGVQRAAQAPGAVAVVGDSRVADLAVSTVAPDAENYGLGSDTLDGAARRIARYRLGRARAVVVEAGINDWWDNRFDGFKRRYAGLLGAVPAGVPVVAAGLVGVEDGVAHRRWSGVNARLGGANATIARLCAARPRCAYAPPFATALPRAAHVGDGVHFSAEGNRAFAVSLRAALAKALG